MEDLGSKMKSLISLDESVAERLEENILKEPEQDEKKTTISLLDRYTSIEKEKVALAEEMKKFLLENEEFARKMNEFNKKKAELDEQQAELKTEMTETMSNENLKNESNGIFDVKFVAETTRENFDKESFKKENSDLYKKYIKKTKVSAYVKISAHK